MNRPAPRTPHRWMGLFPARGSATEVRRIVALLRKETVGGGLLVGMAALALVWANSPAADSYFALRDLTVGYAPWHLDLSVGSWAADGLLTVFFFLVGLELKREFVAGDLRRFSTAVTPIVAAAGGVAVPALIYLAIAGADPSLHHGWAIPTATDIAFAVAVLALIGSHLPNSLRIFLLTLAVVDDLIAIGIIAVVYSDEIHPVPLLLSLVTIAVYGTYAQLRRRFLGDSPAAVWLVLLPLGTVAWGFMHASGIHSTIAGVLLGFTIPVLHHRRDRDTLTGQPGLSEVIEHQVRPLSTGVAVPLFAFFSAGVALGGTDGLVSAATDRVTIAIVAALVLGKPIGILTTTWLMTRVMRVRLDPTLRWVDLIGVGQLAGIGFTVSLLVAELSFAPGLPAHDHAKVAILTGSVVSALLASVLLGARNRHYRRLDDSAVEVETADEEATEDVTGKVTGGANGTF
ncbi:Na+/H+ antiporter NhaA [Raineyella sp.]|uniref:Na+/H+ antiporter NhaA n=1 Tax=Raineyella sp. TaxID=1911550 RepID=UPI002B206363|nr:Na+/H+ antiporter NhaA [Raineyella sp.]MEA5155111.1 Na+/H+ antiporter NhaA [Raineyella sp.]